MGLKDFFKKKPSQADEAKEKAKMIAEVKKKEKILESLKKQKDDIDKQNKLLEEEINKMLKIKDGKFVQSEPTPAPVAQPAPIPQMPQMPQSPQYIPQMQSPLPPQPQQQYAPQMPTQAQERQFQAQNVPAQPELVEVVLRLVDGSELSVAVPTVEVQNLVNEIADSMEKKTFVKLNTTFLAGDKIVFFKLL